MVDKPQFLIDLKSIQDLTSLNGKGKESFQKYYM